MAAGGPTCRRASFSPVINPLNRVKPFCLNSVSWAASAAGGPPAPGPAPGLWRTAGSRSWGRVSQCGLCSARKASSVGCRPVRRHRHVSACPPPRALHMISESGWGG